MSYETRAELQERIAELEKDNDYLREMITTCANELAKKRHEMVKDHNDCLHENYRFKTKIAELESAKEILIELVKKKDKECQDVKDKLSIVHNQHEEYYCTDCREKYEILESEYIIKIQQHLKKIAGLEEHLKKLGVEKA